MSVRWCALVGLALVVRGRLPSAPVSCPAPGTAGHEDGPGRVPGAGCGSGRIVGPAFALRYRLCLIFLVRRLRYSCGRPAGANAARCGRRVRLPLALPYGGVARATPYGLYKSITERKLKNCGTGGDTRVEQNPLRACGGNLKSQDTRDEGEVRTFLHGKK